MTQDNSDEEPAAAAPAAEPEAAPAAAAAPGPAAPEALPERVVRQARSGAFLGVPIEVTISVGKARPLVSELVELRRDSVLTLDSTIDDPVELYIGDRLIARGELQEIGDDSGRLGVRLTEVADFSHEL
jgi:flagellar motor switch protein FliN